MNKRLILMLTTLSLCVSVTACSAKNDDITTVDDSNTQINNIQTVSKESIGEIDTYIELGNDINVKGEGVTLEDNKITITQEGTYSISGELEDGQIIVDADKNDRIELVLDNADITCSDSAPIYIKSADKTIISLADGSNNNLTDGNDYVFEDTETDEPNAVLFSKDDLTIIGNGSLVVNANYNNGIASKDDLVIESGNISVNAVGHGIRGKDSVTILDGEISINSDKDGIKSTNSEDESKGYVSIEGGTINIISGQDGIDAENKVSISDGDITITAGGGSVDSSQESGNLDMLRGLDIKNTDEESDTPSTKGIKASNDIVIDNASINIDSLDDGIHSDDNITINGGTIDIASGDDGIHSDSTLEINDGIINITESYEGIESEVITINGGVIHLVASDDGINAAGKSDDSSSDVRSGGNKSMSQSNAQLNINGGYIYVDASGDGIDANGSIYMTDGVVIVNGPTSNADGALDYDDTFEISGGTLIAAGSAGMAEAPGESSSQNSVSITLSQQEANSIVHIASEDGEEIITFAPAKQYQSIVVSSPQLKTGSTYTVSYGGTYTGESEDGLYSGGQYSGGTEIGSFTVSSSVSTISESGVSINNMPGNNNRDFGGNDRNSGGNGKGFGDAQGMGPGQNEQSIDNIQ